MAEADIFLSLGKDIPGEEKEPKDSIRIEQWSWSESGGGSKVGLSDFNFVMKINKSSPKILEYCANGKNLDSATLICREAVAGAQETYLEIKLTKCKVTYFYTSVLPTNPDSSTVFDSFNLKFEKIEYEYKRGFNIRTSWDTAQHGAGKQG